MKVLITGINGYLAQYLLRFAPQNVKITGSYLMCPDINKRDAGKVTQLISLDLGKKIEVQLKDISVDAVIHTAAISGLGECEKDSQLAERVNGQATKEIAEWCKANRIPLVYPSTDIVFNGNNAPYSEADIPDPVNIYGKSKLAGERFIQKNGGNWSIIRLALLIGSGLGHKKNFVDWFISHLDDNKKAPLFYDEIRTPIFTIDAAKIIWQIVLLKKYGVFHLCGKEVYNRFALGEKICKFIGGDCTLLQKTSLNSMEYKRPVDVSLQDNKTHSFYKNKMTVAKNINYLINTYE